MKAFYGSPVSGPPHPVGAVLCSVLNSWDGTTNPLSPCSAGHTGVTHVSCSGPARGTLALR
eukprot:2590820-Pyramimonas_sp.AAC.1